MSYKISVCALLSRPLSSIIISPNARRKCRFLQFLIPPSSCNVPSLRRTFASSMTCTSIFTVSELQIGPTVRPLSSPHRAYPRQTTPSISCSTFPRENTTPSVDCDVPSGQNSVARFEISTVTNKSPLDPLRISFSLLFRFTCLQ